MLLDIHWAKDLISFGFKAEQTAEIWNYLRYSGCKATRAQKPFRR